MSAEIDWALTTLGSDGKPTTCVQFNVGGNSPVQLSQIACLVVDNNRCSADITFLFPDSAFELAVPAYAGGIFPVFTNTLTFYCIAPQSSAGDVTTFQIMNTVPPPVALLQSQAQAVAAVQGLTVAPATTVLVPTTISGILETISIGTAASGGTSGGTVGLVLRDQAQPTPNLLWAGELSVAPNGVGSPRTDLSSLKIRFFRGIVLTVTLAGTIGGGGINVNVYYSVP
jgi:hypothetical protein